jgi:hypothetical protein
MLSTVFVVGNVDIKQYNDTGNLKDKREIRNTVTAVGKDVISARLVGNTLAIMSHMAAGNSNTAATVTQTALGTELGRVAFDSVARVTNTISYIATFPAGTATGNISEAGIFNNTSGGNMLCRTSFTPLTKASGDTIVITWNVTIQ